MQTSLLQSAKTTLQLRFTSSVTHAPLILRDLGPWTVELYSIELPVDINLLTRTTLLLSVLMKPYQ